ncbi:MAG: hypothetical protein R3C28_11215 [Pirellulaceae bacterium]
MLIKNLFKRNIRARSRRVLSLLHQLDESTVWQELDEFAVTSRARQAFRRFFSSRLWENDRQSKGRRSSHISADRCLDIGILWLWEVALHQDPFTLLTTKNTGTMARQSGPTSSKAKYGDAPCSMATSSVQ